MPTGTCFWIILQMLTSAHAMLLVFHRLWPRTGGFWARYSSQTYRCSPWCEPLHVVLMPWYFVTQNLFTKDVSNPVTQKDVGIPWYKSKGGTNLFLCMFSRPTLYMFDKILIEVGGEGGGERAGGPSCWGSGGSGGRVGGVVAAAAGGDMVGTWGGTPLTAAVNTVEEACEHWDPVFKKTMLPQNKQDYLTCSQLQR